MKNIQLIDLIQMCCLSCANMAIRVWKGSQEGTIFVWDGKIVHTICEGSTGEDAFYRILAWKSGSFEALDTNLVPEATIEKNWQFLLMEAARVADEQAVGEGELSNMGKNISPCPGHDHLRVLVVDDSAVMCRILKNLLTADEDIQVVGTARNGEEALKKIRELKPDVITLDVNMPVMNGSTALKHIMIRNPCPVVIVSTMGSRSDANVLDFLCLGAVGFVSKPARNDDMKNQQEQLIETVKLAGSVKIHNSKRLRAAKILSNEGDKAGCQRPSDLLVVCNSGAGGYAELVKVISLLPKNLHVSLVVLQAMCQGLVPSMSDYVNKRSNLIVQPLETDAQLFDGRCYMGINSLPLKLASRGSGYVLMPQDHRLPVEQNLGPFDLFLHSVADCFSGKVLVILLSGADVGDLDGLRSIRKKNGRIVIQKLTSCMVPYPLERAVQAGLVGLEANTVEIAKEVLDYANC